VLGVEYESIRENNLSNRVFLQKSLFKGLVLPNCIHKKSKEEN